MWCLGFRKSVFIRLLEHYTDDGRGKNNSVSRVHKSVFVFPLNIVTVNFLGREDSQFLHFFSSY